MKLSEIEVMDYINTNRFIIITGTSQGRTRVRKLLFEKLGPKRIIQTRRYYHFNCGNIKDNNLTEIYSLYGELNDNETFKTLKKMVIILEHKQRPVIIDSFTDIQNIVINNLRTVSDNLIKWPLIIQQLNIITNTVKKYKKQLILFCDLKEVTEYKNGTLKHLGYKPNCMKFITDDAQLIIEANDNENLLIKNNN